MILLTVVGLSVVGSLGGLMVAAGLLLLSPEPVRARVLPSLLSYAVGTMLGVATLALLPEALSRLPAAAALGTLLGGVMVFFILEKLVIWRHCHTDECSVHNVTAPLVLLGDAVHNFVDGAVIGAAVMTSLPVGVTTALAVAVHEIPQEVSDFAILLRAGYSRRRAVWFNVLSGACGVAGAVGAYLAFESLPGVLPYFLSFAAASFLYISMADLIPDLQRGSTDTSGVRQIALISLGILTAIVLSTRALR
jgi:zinc and cadmium transporter